MFIYKYIEMGFLVLRGPQRRVGSTRFRLFVDNFFFRLYFWAIVIYTPDTPDNLKQKDLKKDK